MATNGFRWSNGYEWAPMVPIGNDFSRTVTTYLWFTNGSQRSPITKDYHWSRIFPECSRRLRTVSDGLMVRNGFRWFLMVANFHEWLPITNGHLMLTTATNGCPWYGHQWFYRCHQSRMILTGHEFSRIVPDGYERFPKV